MKSCQRRPWRYWLRDHLLLLDSAGGCASFASVESCQYEPHLHVAECRQRLLLPFGVIAQKALVSSGGDLFEPGKASIGVFCQLLLRICLVVHKLDLAKSAVRFMEHKKNIKTLTTYCLPASCYMELFALSPDEIGPNASRQHPCFFTLCLLFLRLKFTHYTLTIPVHRNYDLKMHLLIG